MSDGDDGGDAEADSQFAIPSRPDRRYPHGGGLEYEGETRFVLTPHPELESGDLRGLVERVLDDGPYTFGDWFDLPVPLYTVHDEETGDVFRVVVREGCVELHVLPFTERPGLEGLFERLDSASDREWTVECRVEEG